MEIKAVRGMHDLLGEELERWGFVEKAVRKIFENFGYREIRTPVLEKIEVFSQTVGDETDIVEKQMYQVGGEASEKMVLRPEGTAAFVRAICEHNLAASGLPQRYYYYLPMFRHERPQKGRLRQFHQFGAEFINDSTPEADAEIVILLHTIYDHFNFNEYEIRVNSVGCKECRPVYQEKLKAYFKPHLASLCEQCQKRYERSVMRILDCKKESCKDLVAKAPVISDSLCGDCQTHHKQFKHALELSQIPYIDDPQIVRGLDYYCRTAFEFTSGVLGAQSALCGGGRYDGLATRFGQKSFPAVGFGLGMERLMMALEEKKLINVPPQHPKVFLAALGDGAFEVLLPLLTELRRAGVSADMNFDRTKKAGWVFKHADRIGAEQVVVVGDNEVASQKAQVKNLKDGKQREISFQDLRSELIALERK